MLLHSAAYESVPKERRARLHVRFADWLEEHGVGSDAMLGHHLGEAWRYAGELGRRPALRAELGRRAAAHLVPAAEAAIARSAVPAAVALFGQAAAMQPTGSTEHVDALVELGAALLTGGPARRRRTTALADAEAAARAAGHAPARAHAGVLRLQVALQVDPAPALARIPVVTARAATTFGRGRDELGMCRVEHTRALGHWFAGRCQEAGEAWQRAATHARAGRHEWALPDMLAWVASSLQLGPEPVPSAIARCERLREETQSHPLWQAFVMRPLGLLYAMNGERDRSRAVFEECDRLLDEMGETIHSAAPDREAEAALLEGDAARAERLLRGGFERLEAMGDRAQLSLVATLLARAVEEQGRADEALELTPRRRAVRGPGGRVRPGDLADGARAGARGVRGAFPRPSGSPARPSSSRRPPTGSSDAATRRGRSASCSWLVAPTKRAYQACVRRALVLRAQGSRAVGGVMRAAIDGEPGAVSRTRRARTRSEEVMRCHHIPTSTRRSGSTTRARLERRRAAR